MAKFKAGDDARIVDNTYVLAEYAHQVMAGKTCKIISADTKDGYDGYHVEYISNRGQSYNYFIRAEHLVPEINPHLIQSKPNWVKTAEEWQKKLWASKLE